MNFLNYKRDSTRATTLPISDISKVNEYTMPSDLNENQPISMNHNRRLVTDMINNIFDEEKGTCEVSSSQCSSLKLHSSEYTYDKRLKYWKDVLKEREKVTKKIQQQTGKKPAEILYNHLTTVNDRDKHTVKQLMDYAERMSPLKLATKQRAILPEKCDPKLAIPIQEIQETLPKSERNKHCIVEIIGVPEVIKKELLGKSKNQESEKFSNWLNSKYLEQRIEEKRDDIEHVIEYYPDVENLQIVGESMIKTELKQHDSDIQLLAGDEICHISTDSMDENDNCTCQGKVDTNFKPDDIEYGFKINDNMFGLTSKRSSTNVEIINNFVGFPFQREVKKVITIYNIGRKVLNFEWSRRSYYANNSALLKSLDNEFVFDNNPFRLCVGETHDVFVLYQPRRVSVIKSKWILKVQPAFFCRKLDGIVLRLCGNCTAPPEYVHKLDELQTEVIKKSNMKMMYKLTTGLSAIVPALSPFEQICPYQRTLNEIELFEQLNLGYKCERYHDLELLKNLYKRIKKPRNKSWNLKIDTLKCTILNVTNAESRALYFKELCGILDTMKGKSLELEIRILENPERDRSRLLYVRGIISSTIDEWEDITIALEEAFLKSSLQIFKDKLEKYQSPDDETQEIENILLTIENEDQRHLYILEKHVRRLKPFRDSLYMQTYTFLCNFVENIVNIIESTDYV